MKPDRAANIAIESMKSQLLIVLVNRLGGEIDIPVSEIDATERFVLALQVIDDGKAFKFKVLEK